MYNWGRVYLFAVLMLLFSTGAARPVDDKAIDLNWLAKARDGLSNACEKYKALYPRLETECEYRTEKMLGPTEKKPTHPSTRHERTVRLGNNMLLEQKRILDDMPNSPQIRLQCDNSDYYFTLGKSKDESRYALVEYGLGKRKRPLIQQEGYGQGWHSVEFSYFTHVLAAIERDDNYTLRALQFDEAKRLLRIDYTTRNISSENQLYIDPNHDWRIVERRLETPYLIATEKWTYGIKVAGLDFPKEMKNVTKYKVAKAPPDMAITGRLISIKVTDKTPDDFRLSTFGIPEPADAPPPSKPTRWYLWILLAAGLCAALSFGFGYLRRRRRQARNP